MPENDSPPVTPPGPGASGEEILRQMLPVLVDALTKSAAGHTTSAATIQALETQVSELKAVVQSCHSEFKRIADAEEEAGKRREENGKWLRSLLRPETIYYTVVIILTALGFRLSAAPVPLSIDLPTQQPTQSGDLP